MAVNIPVPVLSPSVGVTFTYVFHLLDYTTPQIPASNPLIVAGDAVLLRQSGGTWSIVGALATTPALVNAGTNLIDLLLTITAAEIPAETQAIAVRLTDQTSPAAWCSLELIWAVEEDRAVGTSDFAGGAVASVTAGVTLANDAITAAALSAGAVSEIQDGLATDANQTTILSLLTNIGETVWTYIRRTLTMTKRQVEATFEEETIIIHRGDSMNQPLELGDITAYDELWFSVKSNLNDRDGKSLIQITLTGGLLYINKRVAEDDTNGEFEVVDQNTGKSNILLAPVETAKLPYSSKLFWDVQGRRISDDGIVTIKSGPCEIEADVTRSI